VRIRTVAGKQWTVGRAFNRLLKIAFDKYAIASRDPTQLVIVGEPRSTERSPRQNTAAPQWRRA
jgi:hypothetical protein